MGTLGDTMSDGCTTLIVTGDKAEGPNDDYAWGIMVKNSDTGLGARETPVHVAAAPRTFEFQDGPLEANHSTFNGTNYAYTCGYATPSGLSGLPVALTDAVFGQNETGLTVCYGAIYGAPMNTDDTPYGMTNVLSLGGRELTTAFLAFYDDVDDIITDLLDSTTIIGKYNRRGAQVVSVIDNTGKGVVFEISVNKVVYETVVNDFFATGNVSRMWNLNAQGEATVFEDYDDSGNRSQYMANVYNALINENNGKLNYKDAVKYAARYVNYKEDGDENFDNNISSYWEICNDGTYASMVGVTGDTRYAGKLNCFWGEYGNSPIVGCYLPHIAYAGALPLDGAGAWSDGYPNNYMYNHVEQVKKVSAMAGGEWVPATVSTIQEYSFVVENYTFEQWENMLDTIAGGLGDPAVEAILNALIDASQITATASYRAGAYPKMVTYNSDPTALVGVTAQHVYDSPASTPINDEMSIPVVDGQTITLSFPVTAELDTTVLCTLTVDVIGPTVGAQACSVTLNPAGGNYAPGTVVTLTPTPGSYYQFHGWDGDLTGMLTPALITMNKDRNVTCNFQYIVGTHAGKAAYFGAGYVNENNGIVVTATWPTGGNGLDGNALADATENPFYTRFFFHGDGIGATPLLGDQPVIQVTGNGLYIRNCFVDDNTDNSGTWKPVGLPANVCIADGGNGNSITNCTLDECKRYGIGTQGANNFYIAYNTVNMAQYCISGSGGLSTGGLVELNNLRGMTRNGVKARGWDTVIFRNNFMDLTEIHTPQTGSITGLYISADSPYTSDCVFEHNVVARLINTGATQPSYAFSAEDHDLPEQGPLFNTRNIIRNNVFYNVTRPGFLHGNPAAYSSFPADYDFEVTGNTNVNSTWNIWSDSGYYNNISGNTDI